MYAIAAVGLLTIFLSLIMLASPKRWSLGILTFAAKPYFHLAEILSRLFLGGVLVLFAGRTSYPLFIAIVGGIFLFARGISHRRRSQTSPRVRGQVRRVSKTIPSRRRCGHRVRHVLDLRFDHGLSGWQGSAKI